MMFLAFWMMNINSVNAFQNVSPMRHKDVKSDTEMGKGMAI